MVLNIQKLLRGKAEPHKGEEIYDFSNRDFPAFEVPRQVQFKYEAMPEGSAVRLVISLTTEVAAECARCLAPLTRNEVIEKTYIIRAQDLEEDFPELPIVDGKLDLEELAYSELVLEVPAVLFCSEDCPGLCAACGLLKSECNCQPEEEGDPRLQILKHLLQ